MKKKIINPFKAFKLNDINLNFSLLPWLVFLLFFFFSSFIFQWIHDVDLRISTRNKYRIKEKLNETRNVKTVYRSGEIYANGSFGPNAMERRSAIDESLSESHYVFHPKKVHLPSTPPRKIAHPIAISQTLFWIQRSRNKTTWNYYYPTLI